MSKKGKTKSQDIRSFFTVSPKAPAADAVPKKKKVNVISSDDEETNSPSTHKKSKPTKKQKKTNIFDSDDELESSKKSEKDATPSRKRKAKPPVNIFEDRPVSRVNAKIVSKTLLKKEAEFHQDDDFEAALIQLDTSDLEAVQEKSESHDEKTTGKRKLLDEPDELVEKKKARHDSALSSEDKGKKDQIKENGKKTSSPSSAEKKSRKEGTTLDKKIKLDEEVKEDVKTEGRNGTDGLVASSSKPAKKLNFGNLKPSTNKLEIVVEKNPSPTKDKKEDVSIDLLEEHVDKKKQRNVLYNRYLDRGGARNPGSKPIPEGAENCFAGLSFLITGVLDSLEREEAEELIHKYGGKTVKALSKKTNYMVVGDEAGPVKLQKATSYGTKQISEDELLDLIRTRPAGKSTNLIPPKNPKPVKRSPSPEKLQPSPKKSSPKKSSPPKEKEAAVQPAENSMEIAKVDPPAGSSKDEGTRELALVEKYRPTTMARIIGQHGDRSAAKKLYLWLSKWHDNFSKLKKSKSGAKPFLPDGGLFKACLLSGPPGVGKTTTAQVVCAELGYDILEFNASDTRSKTLLQAEVSSILSNTTIKGYFSNAPEQKVTKKHVLLMDEVDGMAGNEDRGGLQELIGLIKNTEVPIICICNDRQIPKMRTLANYTFDLSFPKPKLEQIRGAMKTLCHKENIKATSEDIDRLIISTNYDIRQVINHLAMYGVKSSKNEENSAEARASKDVRLGPWEVVRRVFSAEEHKKMSIHDKSDLFFHDYNLAGLFVQQNYASVHLSLPTKATLQRIASAADSLAMGDLVDNAIRSNNAWSLLPTLAIFSSVIPGTMMSGRPGQIMFPEWLGKNSSRMKLDRLTQQLSVHTRLTSGVSKETLNLENAQYLMEAIARPLVSKKNDGIDEAINVMNTYHLTREDFESLTEITTWPDEKNLATEIDSKVKAAFTRAYNKNAAPLPYMNEGVVKKKKKMQASQDEGFMDGDDADEGSDNDNDDDDLDGDKMVKVKKVPSSDKASSSKASTSKATSSRKPAAKPSKRGRVKAK